MHDRGEAEGLPGEPARGPPSRGASRWGPRATTAFLTHQAGTCWVPEVPPEPRHPNPRLIMHSLFDVMETSKDLSSYSSSEMVPTLPSAALGSGTSKKLPLALSTQEAHCTSFSAETVAGVAVAVTAGREASHLTCCSFPAGARLWLRSCSLHDKLRGGHHSHPHFTDGDAKAQDSWCSRKHAAQVGLALTHESSSHTPTGSMERPHNGSGRKNPREEGFSGQHPVPPTSSRHPLGPPHQSTT